MANKASGIEENLNDIFVNKAPKLPDGGKKALVEWAPILSVIIGILSVLSAWTLWNWAREVDGAVSYINQVCGAGNSLAANSGYLSTCGGSVVSRFSVWLWLGVLFLAAEGLLYIFAYSGLKARKKQGWNYLYYGALLNVAYAVISLFTSYDVAGHFVGALIGSAIGFYLLFQIRNTYLESKRPATPVEAVKK